MKEFGKNLKAQIDAVERVIEKDRSEERIAERLRQKIKEDSHRFPKGLKWEEVSIKFLDHHEVLITTGNKPRFHSNYEEMGFKDNRKSLPNSQWDFLCDLSKNDGVLDWSHKKASIKRRKQKQLLSKALKEYFEIDSDPFYPYKEEKAYKIKILLEPEAQD